MKRLLFVLLLAIPFETKAQSVEPIWAKKMEFNPQIEAFPPVGLGFFSGNKQLLLLGGGNSIQWSANYLFMVNNLDVKPVKQLDLSWYLHQIVTRDSLIYTLSGYFTTGTDGCAWDASESVGGPAKGKQVKVFTTQGVYRKTIFEIPLNQVYPCADPFTLIKIQQDHNGDLYLIGNLYTSAELNGQIYQSEGLFSSIIIKINTEGKILWVSTIKNINYRYYLYELVNRKLRGYMKGIRDVEIDEHDNLYFYGNLSKGAKIEDAEGKVTVTDTSGAAVLKYDKQGRMQWAKLAGRGAKVGGVNGEWDMQMPRSNNEVEIYKFHIDPLGNMYIIWRNNSLGIKIGANSYDNCNLFIVKYDSEGKALWVRELQSQYISNLDSYLDKNGNFLVYFNYNINLFLQKQIEGKTSSSGLVGEWSNGGAAGTVLVFRPNGKLLHTFTVDGEGSQEITMMSVSDEGQVYLGGDFDTEALLGNTLLSGYGSFLAKYDLSTTLLPTEPEAALPSHVTLAQNYPNPFNLSTNIQYTLANETLVQLSVYNLLGRKVRTLLEGHQSAGIHEVQFNAGDLSGGLYFYQLTTANQQFTKSFLLIK